MRQEETIKSFMDVDIIKFINELPYKEGVVTENIVARFQKSLYGFKPHAIQVAIDKGYTKIIWFDPSVLPTVSPQVIFDELDFNPMLVIKGDAEICSMTNINAIKWFGLKKEDLYGIKHIGGTMYAFNFENELARKTFDLWKLAEESGIFGDQNEFMTGHWADEACMVLAMYKNGVDQVKSEFTYLNQKDL
jgi:hypothetical protein